MAERPKVCMVTSLYPSPSKPIYGLFVQEQAREMARQGVEVTVVTGGERQFTEQESTAGVSVVRVGAGRSRLLPGSVYMAKVLLSLNRTAGFDIVHGNWAGSYLLVPAIIARALGMPFVVTAHGADILPRGAAMAELAVKLCLALASKVICVSDYTAQLAERLVNRSKVRVVYNGIDLAKHGLVQDKERFIMDKGLQNKLILLSVCDLVRRKGLDTIIRVLPQVVEKFPNLTYIVVGRGPEEENLKQQARALQLTDHVSFLGWLSDAELASYYSVCDVFVMMSKTIAGSRAVEGFGIAYIEASAFGKPVIGGRSGGTASAIVDSQTGFLIEPDDLEGLRDKLLLLLGDPGLRKEMGEKGRKRVMEGFLWEHNVRKVVAIYRELLSRV